MSDQTEYRTGDLPNLVEVKQLRNLYNIALGIGSSTTTDIIAELEKITQNTADIEITAENINLNTDGIEGKQDTQITRMGTNGDASDIAGSQAAQIRAVGDKLDTLETTLSNVSLSNGSILTDTTSINTKIKAQSGAITQTAASTGGTSNHATGVTATNYLAIQNLDGTNPMHVNFGAVATASHFRLAAGEKVIFENYAPTSEVNLISPAAGVNYAILSA